MNDLTASQILITDGTGSFGRHFLNQVLESWKPKRVVVYSRDELKQYQMRLEYPVD